MAKMSRREAVTALAATGGALAITAPAAAHAAGSGLSITEETYGSVGGQAVQRYTLSNANGLQIKILTYGGIIQTVTVPGKHGHPVNLVLGFPTLDDYVNLNSPLAGGGVYFGALVGRYANRIAKGTFTLDGVTYHVPINNNGNSLHGGTVGFNQKVWTPTVVKGGGTVGLRLEYVSPDGEMGYPGTLTTVATYTLDNTNRLTLNFHATTDKPTIVNLTNHTYWNLAGESSGQVYDQLLMINADRYTPTDSTQIPTGALVPVAGTPFDFTELTPIGARIATDDKQLLIGQGFDHNWVLNRHDSSSLVLAARACDPESGRTLSIWTTQPGIQFYSGNFLNGTLVGTSDHVYRQSYGFALETQHYPDSPNHANFPSTVLRPGQTYDQTSVYQVM